MIPGDHLQFLYYCWLAGDMLTGKTPLFHNLYEFNTGDDRARFQPDPYFIPFSLVYTAGSWLGGRAFGWNLTGFLSIWLTLLMTWILVRRYTLSEWISGVSAIVAIALPFRWICLLGGSPSGFAMMWIPVVWLGIDLAVREYSVRGGFLAGVAVLFSCWTDMHVFFFAVLTIPAWCIIALIYRTEFGWKRLDSYIHLFKALIPVILLTALALGFPSLMKWLAEFKTGLATAADMVGKRSLREVTLYSPNWKGFFTWHRPGSSGLIYIGYTVVLFLVTGGLTLLWQSIREWKRHWRSLLILALLCIGITGIGCLALGTRGPAHGAMLKLCRLIIPPYGMIRQPAKIFCLMPSFLSVALAMALTALVNLKKRGWRFVIPVIFVSLIITEYALRVNPTVSLLENQQQAYAAVANDAAVEGKAPRALVIPLWPGDSHYSSVYQYFASLYRVRMINGYTPFIKQDYFDNVFRRFESINQGDLSDDQIQALLDMNINTILVHEDLFPEKVSPFPVTFTLRQLLNHPRLRLLEQDGRVWAFKILPEPVEKKEILSHWDIFGSARKWEAESCRREHTATMADPATGGNAFIALAEPGAWMGTTQVRVGRAPNLRWLVRARGAGTLSAHLVAEGRTKCQIPLAIDTSNWIWLTIPVTTHDTYSLIALKLERQQGVIDIDSILLTAGQWQSPKVGQDVSIPGPCFFHAGYINRDHDSVVLKKDRDPKALVFYGPKLPLEKGRYQVQFIFRTEAPEGTELGQYNIRRGVSPPGRINWTPVKAGQPARTTFIQDENLIMHLEFLFFRNADMEIDRVIFTRLE